MILNNIPLILLCKTFVKTIGISRFAMFNPVYCLYLKCKYVHAAYFNYKYA